VIFLASDVRRPRGGGDDALARLAAETGVEGIHFGGGADLALVDAQAPTILRLGLGIPSLALPLPERPLPVGRRLPRLAAHARDEREAAIELALRGLEAATTLGARFAVLDFGEVTRSRGVRWRRTRQAGVCWARRWRNGARAATRSSTPVAGRSSAWFARRRGRR
jgi:hypothetical protein